MTTETLSAAMRETDGALLVDIAANLEPEERSACRAAMLKACCMNRPIAAMVYLPEALGDDQRIAACELLQYADLCIIDRSSAAQLGIACRSAHSDPAAALARKLQNRFAFGGVALPDEGYVWLDSAQAEMLWAEFGGQMRER